MKKVFWKRALAVLLAVCLVTVFVPDALPRAAAVDSEVSHSHEGDPEGTNWIPLSSEKDEYGSPVLKVGEETLTTRQSMILSTGNYYLADDVDLADITGTIASVTFKGKTVLCLNEHTMTTMIYAASQSDLTVYDCEDGGAITNSKSCTVQVSNGGSLRLVSGTLENNGSSSVGKTVWVLAGGKFEMLGGTVTAPTVHGVENEGTTVISGGTISTTAYAIRHLGGTLTLSGSPVLSGTGQRNADIYLAKGQLITLENFTGAPERPYTVETKSDDEAGVCRFATGAVSGNADSFLPTTAGLVTIYREDGELWFRVHEHQWEEGWSYDESEHWHECVGAGTCDKDNKADTAPHTVPDGWLNDTQADQHYKKCTVCGAEFLRADHSWTEGSSITDGTRTDTCSVCGATRTVKLYGISGKVVMTDETPIAEAKVELKQGANTVGETVTDANGAYSFTNVDPGVYNVVASVTEDGDTKTATILVTVSGSDLQDQDLVMPIQGNVSSELTVQSDTAGVAAPNVVVGGLQEEAAQQAENNASVSVSMTVKYEGTQASRASEGTTDINEEVRGAFDNAERDKVELQYFQIDVEKEVLINNKRDETLSGEISETSRVLTIVIPYSMGGRTNVAVHRYHDDEVEKLERLWSEPSEPKDGTFRADLEHNLIYIYANKFSAYAISSTNSNNVPEKEPEPVQENVNPYYPVAVPANPNGTVSVTPTSAAAGTTVTVTVTPSDGYVLDTLKVTQVGTGTAVEVTAGADGTYTFAMPAGGATVTATFKEKEQEVEPPVCPSEQLTDIEETAWYHDAVDYVVDKGLMDGVDDTTFAPNAPTTRAMLVTILYRLDGEPAVTKSIPFSDVAAGQWYSDAINWAAANEIVGGYGDDTFRPDRDLTREEAATILYRYAAYKKYDVTTTASLTGYTDAASVQSYATAPMSWAVGTELIGGTTATTLAPSGGAIRAQIATILMRFCENIVK